MIQVKVLNNNNIVTLQKEGGLPIKSSQGFMFYNSNELLCVAVGSCVGRNMVILCSQEDIDVDSFEYVGIDMESHKLRIVIKCPKEMDEKKRELLKNRLEGCELVTNLKKAYDIKVELLDNDTPTEQVVEANRTGKPCCGG